jgi:hypothetical protein
MPAILVPCFRLPKEDRMVGKSLWFLAIACVYTVAS